MYQHVKKIIGILALGTLGACATPGIDYTASVAPGNPTAAELRNIAVERFRGPLSGWYADAFENMLQQANFDGQPWFQVGLFSRQSNVEGVYGGDIQISDVYVDEHYHTTSTCVEKDKETKKCIKKKEIENVCIDYSIDVAVTPKLLNVRTQNIVHNRTYSAGDSERECFETGKVVYRVRRGPGDPGRGKYRVAYRDYQRPGYRLGGDHIVDRITASALDNTIWQIRRDIAPYNRQVRATVLTDAENPGVRADPRFKQAVQGIRNENLSFACQTFAVLSEDYPGSPAVLHNLGACAEASGESADAQAYYAQASSAAQALGSAPAKRILNALDRISSTRNNELVLDSLVPQVP